MATVPQRALILRRVSSPSQADRQALGLLRGEFTGPQHEQEEGDKTSLATQERLCLDYCEGHGYEVLGTHTDIYSGKYWRERKGLQAARQRWLRGEVDVVVALNLDRFSRNQAATTILIDEIEHHGARLELVQERFDDTSEGRLIRSVRAFTAEIELEKIVERTQRGKQGKLASGRLVASSKPSYGYQFSPDKGALEEDPMTAPVVRQIFGWYLQGVSQRAIAMRLSAEGIPSPTGKPEWAYPTVAYIIKKPDYAGRATRAGGAFTFSPEVCPPLVDEATFQAAQGQLARNSAEATRNNHHYEDTLLRGGRAVCAHCGWTMTVSTVGKTPVYRCGRVRGRSTGGRCEYLPSVTTASLDAAAWQFVTAFASNPEAIFALEERNSAQDMSREELARVDHLIGKIHGEITQLVVQLGRFEGPALTAVEARLTELSRQEQLLSAEASTLRAQTTTLDGQHRARAEIIAYCQQRYIPAAMASMAYDERRQWLAALGVKLRVRARSSAGPRWDIQWDSSRIVNSVSGSAIRNAPTLHWLSALDLAQLVA